METIFDGQEFFLTNIRTLHARWKLVHETYTIKGNLSVNEYLQNTTRISAGYLELIQEVFPDDKGVADPTSPIVIQGQKLNFQQDEKFVYIKGIHWKKKTEGGSPVYSKYIDRLERDVEVYDEIQYMRLNRFSTPQEKFKTRDRSSGVIDVINLHPWKDVEYPDADARLENGDIYQVIYYEKPSANFFIQATYFNGFQPGHEDVAMLIEVDTQSARMVVDFSSIPHFVTCLRADPTGFRKDARTKSSKNLPVQKVRAGLFAIEDLELNEGDVLVLDFTGKIDWNKVPV